MGRNTIKTEYLSLDTIAIIDKMYPKRDLFFYKHLAQTDITIQVFYAAMRHDPITPDAEQLIESSLTYDLVHLGVTRDTLAIVPALPDFLKEVAEALSNTEIFEGYALFRLEEQSHSRLVQLLKFFAAQLSP